MGRKSRPRIQKRTQGINHSRRQFLQTTLIGTSVLGLGGCSLFDSYFSSEKDKLDNEVLIVGGGLAGLSAAYELKKSRIPFRLYESQFRLGGRVETHQGINAEGQYADLGGEFVQRKHQAIFDLCHELSLGIDEFAADSSSLIGLGRSHIVLQKEMQEKLAPLRMALVKSRLSVTGDSDQAISALDSNILEKAKLWDNFSIQDLLVRFGQNIPAEPMGFFRNSLICQFGKPLDEVSCLQLLTGINVDISANSREQSIYRIRGGSERLVRSMLERVSGILPNFLVRADSPLVRIRYQDPYFVCSFSGRKSHTLRTKYLIMAIPANQYKFIDGFEDLPISKLKLQSLDQLQLAQHGKMIMNYREKFWQKSSGKKSGGLEKFNFEKLPLSGWDIGEKQIGNRGLLAFLSSEDVGPKLSEEVHEIINTQFPTAKLNREASEDIYVNWGKRTFINGSYIVYGPGNFSRYHGIWSESDVEGRLYYAGEHCHLRDFGTMCGAVETGISAAKAMAKKITQELENDDV